MSVSKETKKAEAVSRMKSIGIFSETIRQFEEEDYISVSEPPIGAFYWAKDEDLERIREFEEEYNTLVYMVIRSYTSIGILDNYLYVSDHDDEWELDHEDIKDNMVMAYVYNHNAPDCSEIGRIGIELTCAGGLKRTC